MARRVPSSAPGPGLAIDRAAWNNRWRERPLRQKVTLAVVLLVAAMAARSALVHGAVVVIALGCLIAGARVRAGLVARALAAPLLFVVLGAMAAAVSIGSPPAQARWAAGVFWVDESAWQRSLFAATRSVAAASAVMLLAMTTPMTSLLDGARRARVPAVVVEIAGLVYRMLFIVLETAGTVRRTQEARLGHTSRATAVRSVAWMFSATLRASWLRASRLAAGLEGRGFDGRLAVTTRPSEASAGLTAASALAAITLTALVVTTW